GGAGSELEPPLMPRAVDELPITDHHRVTGHTLVDDRLSAKPSRAQGTALMWAVVRDCVEGAVDVVHPDAVPADRHQFVGARGDLVDGSDDVLAPLRQPGR